jgi:hypothetical protein
VGLLSGELARDKKLLLEPHVHILGISQEAGFVNIHIDRPRYLLGALLDRAGLAAALISPMQLSR